MSRFIYVSLSICAWLEGLSVVVSALPSALFGRLENRAPAHGNGWHGEDAPAPAIEALALVQHEAQQRLRVSRRQLEAPHRSEELQGLGRTYSDWKLCDAEVHSNLGGFGPDSGPRRMRYKHVVRNSAGEDLDLLITNATFYTPHDASMNGKAGSQGCLGNLNVAHDSSVTLNFHFVKAGTQDPEPLEKFFFSVFDIDRSSDCETAVTFPSDGGVFWVDPNSNLNVTGGGFHPIAFHATHLSHHHDNPSSATDLPQPERARAVTVEYADRSSFQLTIHLKGGNRGRNFIFSGYSPLALAGRRLMTSGRALDPLVDPNLTSFEPTPSPTLEPTMQLTEAPTTAPTPEPPLSSWSAELARFNGYMQRDLDIVTRGSGYGPASPVPDDKTEGKSSVGGAQITNNVKLDIVGNWNIVPGQAKPTSSDTLEWISDLMDKPLTNLQRFRMNMDPATPAPPPC